MKKLFYFLFVFLSFPANPQTYIITEQQLQIIENYKVKSEMEKQNWLSQVKILNLQITELRNESTILNQQVTTLSNQLQNQREVNKNLEKSYNQLEIDQSQKINKLSNELIDYKEKYTKEKNRFKTTLIMVIIESVLIILLILLLFYKDKIQSLLLKL